MSGRLEFTILGSGSSGGVPRSDGDWGVCDPTNPKNLRTRCGAVVRRRNYDGAETTVLIDTAPDLRLQTAAAGVRRVDAVLYTHDHADQVNGIDDLRAFFLKTRQRTPCFMDARTRENLMRRFGYIFEGEGGYPAICDPVELPPIGTPFVLDGPSGTIPVETFDQDHGDIRSVGYRFGDIAYSSDVVGLPEKSFEALGGVRVWIVDALRDRPHPTHANVEEALAWIARVRPDLAILTNLHIDLDYEELAARLPANVVPAYDGMVIETEL
jgi:phosphoribosyl 1,2-cyclic phosphate phosphodiesterase